MSAMSDPICGEVPPNVRNPDRCHLDPDHDGQHFSTTGCRGSEIRWTTTTNRARPRPTKPPAQDTLLGGAA